MCKFHLTCELFPVSSPLPVSKVQWTKVHQGGETEPRGAGGWASQLRPVWTRPGGAALVQVVDFWQCHLGGGCGLCGVPFVKTLTPFMGTPP